MIEVLIGGVVIEGISSSSPRPYYLLIKVLTGGTVFEGILHQVGGLICQWRY